VAPEVSTALLARMVLVAVAEVMRLPAVLPAMVGLEETELNLILHTVPVEVEAEPAVQAVQDQLPAMVEPADYTEVEVVEGHSAPQEV